MQKYIIKYSANRTGCENEMLQVTQIKFNHYVSHSLLAKVQPLPALIPDYRLWKQDYWCTSSVYIFLKKNKTI